jgi:hypothetical protein
MVPREPRCADEGGAAMTSNEAANAAVRTSWIMCAP